MSGPGRTGGPLRVGVVGATGYVGSELIRWILGHPHLELAIAVSTRRAGERLDRVVPALQGFSDHSLEPFDGARLSTLDVVFLATPHGKAAPLVTELSGAATIVDCSADHRHAAGWVYGLPEWARESLSGATRIAAPGCFASAIALSLAPLFAARVAGPSVHIVAATGSTGSGASPSAGTHHPARFTNLKAYKVLQHQHVPEVQAFLSGFGPAPTLHFVPLSAPVDRGILATSFVPLTQNIDARTVFADAYADAPLVRLREETPELRHVRGTALCDLAVHQQGDTAVVIAAIDNLGRGAAAQAIQALNLSQGWPGTTGLFAAPLTP